MNTTIHKKSAARDLLLQESFGVLSTMSLDVPGYPFGSVTPYCVDDECRPLIYISHIAQHTRNIIADPRVSLTVVENNVDSDDVQAHGRADLPRERPPALAPMKRRRETIFPLFSIGRSVRTDSWLRVLIGWTSSVFVSSADSARLPGWTLRVYDEESILAGAGSTDHSPP